MPRLKRQIQSLFSDFGVVYSNSMSDEEKTVVTDFLFARPSFLSGVGRLFDLWGKYDGYNNSASTNEADMRALYSDWRITGQDLRAAWFAHHEDEAGNSSLNNALFVCPECQKIVQPTRGGASLGKAEKKIHRRDHRRGGIWATHQDRSGH